MIVIACIDDNCGMMFNNRRQSRDRVIIEKIIDIADGQIWMNHYSYSLFEKGESHRINIDDAFLSEATEGDYCFVENCSLKQYEKYIEKIILFKWNRVYPADLHFDIDLSGWMLSQSKEFVGNSHELITMEVYER